MRTLQFSFVVSIWPWAITARHDFDGETHRYCLALGPIGFNLYAEPLSH
jgi:hypothetical protein